MYVQGSRHFETCVGRSRHLGKGKTEKVRRRRREEGRRRRRRRISPKP